VIDNVLTGNLLLLFWRSMLPPSSGQSKKKLVTNYQLTQLHVPEDCSLHPQCCENL